MSDFPADHLPERTTRFSAEPPMGIDPNKRYTAVMSTSKGDMTIALAPERAPKTVNSFVFLARHGYYDGLNFHRIIPGFMAQGGCPEGSGRGGPGYRFADDRYGVALWGKNIFNRFYHRYAVNLQGSLGYDYLHLGDPRTYGISFDARF